VAKICSPDEDTLDFTMKITGKFTKIASQLKEGEEVIVEAPRGTLYYYLEFDSAGNIALADLVIPTAQNQVMMEKDIGLLVQQCLDQNIPRDQIEREIEILIRAYDPCMSCATHFLQVNWNNSGK